MLRRGVRVLSKAQDDQKVFDTASLFSGTDIAYLCLSLLVAQMAGKTVKACNKFSVEIDAQKQKFMLASIHTFNPASAVPNGACIFKNIAHLCQGVAAGIVHKVWGSIVCLCPVPKAHYGPTFVSACFLASPCPP